MTELKSTGFVYIHKDNKSPTVHIKHELELTIKGYKYVGNNKIYKFPFLLRDDENNIEAEIVVQGKSDGYLYSYLQLSPEDQYKIQGTLKFIFLTNFASNTSNVVNEFSITPITITVNGWGGICISDCCATYYTKNNNLIITCEIYLNLKKNITPMDTQPLHQNQMSKDFGLLLSTETFSDITFKVGDKKLKAHKPILSARSPVFNRMFQSDMAETQLNTVEIKDMDFEVVQTLLIYIYTDEVDNIDTNAEGVLAAAEKYQLDNLKAKCGVFLSKGLTVENAVQRFILADLYREDYLKARTVEFINRHRMDVMKTEEWKTAKETHGIALAMAFL